MNLRKSFAATFAAGAILLSTVMSGAAETTSITVTPGSLDASIVSMQFSDVPFGFQDQQSNGTLKLRAIDRSGDGSPWTVNFVMGDFEGEIQHTSFVQNPASFQLTPNGLGGQAVSGQTFTLGTWSAPANQSGDYLMTQTGSITVPAYTLAGTYEANISISATDSVNP